MRWNSHDLKTYVPCIEVEWLALVVCALYGILHVIGVFAFPHDILWQGFQSLLKKYKWALYQVFRMLFGLRDIFRN